MLRSVFSSVADILAKASPAPYGYNKRSGLDLAVGIHNVSAPNPSNDRPAEIRFEVVFDLPGSTGDFVYLLAFQSRHPGHGYQLFEEALSLHGREIYHSREGKWLTEPPVVPSISPTGLALDRISGVEDVVSAYHMLTGGIGCYDFSGDVLCVNRGDNAGRWPQLGLSDDGGNYQGVLDALTRDFKSVPSRKAILAAVKLLNGMVASVDLDMPARQRVLVGHRFGEQITTMELAQQSEGFRRFLAHLLAMYG